jgi:hypothetical protein
MAYTGLGSKISISAGLSSTYDNNATTGFPSLTYTVCTGLLSNGSTTGGTWGSTSDTYLESGEVVESKTSLTAQEFSVSHFADETNAGIELLQTAFANKTDYYSFKLEDGAGNAKYFQARVMSMTETGTDTEAHDKIEYTIKPRALESVKVAA